MTPKKLKALIDLLTLYVGDDTPPNPSVLDRHYLLQPLALLLIARELSALNGWLRGVYVEVR